MKSRNYFTGIILFIFCSCGNSEKDLQQVGISDTIVNNKLVMIPKDLVAESLNDTAYAKITAKMLDLPDLSEISEDLRLRIWLWDEEVKYVIDFIGKDEVFRCDVTEWNSRHTDSGEVIIVQHRVVNVQPTSGWTSISSGLGKLEKVLEGRPYDGRTGTLTHMSKVVFELGRKKSYSYREYLMPSFYRYVHPDAMEIHNFLKTINNEFRLKAYLPSEKLYAESEEHP